MKLKQLFLVIAALLFSFGIYAQKTVEIAKNHLESQLEKWDLLLEDIQDVRVSDHYQSKHNGVTHVYLQQQYEGIPVYNAISNFNIMPSGIVIFANNRFYKDLSAITNATAPTLSPEQAIEAAVAHLEIADAKLPELKSKDENGKMIFEGGTISNSDIPVELVFQPTADQKLSLAWHLAIDMKTSADYWSLRIDALTGELLQKNNYTVYCQHAPTLIHGGEDCVHQQHNYFGSSAMPELTVTDGASYRVFPFPAESPIHGELELVVNPADSIASPLGWHEVTDITKYTITRGNNAHAYSDTSDVNESVRDEPDGGENLVFDFPFDPTKEPEANLEFAVTQLFYSNNAIHDFVYAYGFDEASGNFQQRNFTQEGTGGDPVQAEAQDGGGTNNANFATLPDGANGRMQMFLWNRGNGLLEVTAPEQLAGVYETGTADFGIAITDTFSLTGEVVVARDGTSDPTLGCEAIENDIAGKIALVDRGSCFFSEKALNAQQAGATGLIICNFENRTIGMSAGTDDEITIPVLLIASGDCERLRAFANGELIVKFERPDDGGPAQIDGTLDNGIVAHEYGHGISSRLTGGPSAAGCLFNDEQMGEGWSDFFTLVTTVKEGDVGTMGRGIGAYVQEQGTDGSGFRRFQYSTDASINRQTYFDINGTTAPHPLGEVWTSVLWDLYWALVDQYGWDADPYNKQVGNNIAIQLVMDGMKFQGCNPGFIDGRDGILGADLATYEGAHQCLIWEVFANRGFGWEADQGSNQNRNDGVENYDVLPDCFNNIQVTKSMTPYIEAGDTITVTIEVTNYKAETVTEVMAKDQIPAGMEVLGVGTVSELDIFFESLAPFQTEKFTYQMVSPADNFSSRVFLDEAEDFTELWNYDIWENDDNQYWFIEAGTGVEESSAWFVTNTGGADMDQSLQFATPVAVTGERPVLKFDHRYETAWGFDGGILQLSTDGFIWMDAKDNFIRNGYNTQIAYGAFAQPDQLAFAGEGDNFRSTYVDLSEFIGEEVYARFRFGSPGNGDGVASTGWFVDNIEVMDMLNYNTEVCVTTNEGDLACATAKEAGTIVATDMMSTSTEESFVEANSFEVFPNPASQNINIALSTTDNADLSIKLYGVDGKLYLAQQTRALQGANQFTLPTTALTPGFYILKIEDGENILSQKLVIEE